MKTLTLNVSDLRPGDEFWGDRPYKHDTDEQMVGDYLVYQIVGPPITSTNQSLFPVLTEGDPTDPVDSTCVVVACEYADGGRGSRVFSPKTEITIRRP